jgi:hypothetical protein
MDGVPLRIGVRSYLQPDRKTGHYDNGALGPEGPAVAN